MIAKVRTYDYREVCDKIERIVRWAKVGNVHHMIYAMKMFVPEYKSNQSQFEAIDHEIEQSQTKAPQHEPETEKYY